MRLQCSWISASTVLFNNFIVYFVYLNKLYLQGLPKDNKQLEK